MSEPYRLCSIQKGTSRQAPFGVWGPAGTNGQNETVPLTIQESYGEYDLTRQLGVADQLITTLPAEATGIEIFDALAAAEGLWCTWATQWAQIRAEMIESEDLQTPEEIARFDASVAAGPSIQAWRWPA